MYVLGSWDYDLVLGFPDSPSGCFAAPSGHRPSAVSVVAAEVVQRSSIGNRKSPCYVITHH